MSKNVGGVVFHGENGKRTQRTRAGVKMEMMVTVERGFLFGLVSFHSLDFTSFHTLTLLRPT